MTDDSVGAMVSLFVVAQSEIGPSTSLSLFVSAFTSREIVAFTGYVVETG